MEKKIGFLSFGHWQPNTPPMGNRSLRPPLPGSLVRTGRDALVQSVDLAVAAEELGVDGAFVRVHHFARPPARVAVPLLTAMAVRTRRLEIGTGVIDMRYENPLYMAEEAAAADLLGDGRLQLGVSRGPPETALRGSEAFGSFRRRAAATPTSPGTRRRCSWPPWRGRPSWTPIRG
jgi:alkanesulfonate monooxygenase SsuD/methylene tetrahydromethanopterin reductase-like flavin-dependent oxidoreductase (luciferase family)